MCKSVFTWHLKNERFYEICPSLARYKFDAYSAQGRLDIARAIIEKEISFQNPKIQEILYSCNLCGGCDYICGRIKEIQPGEIIRAMRTEYVKSGGDLKPELTSFINNSTMYDNPYHSLGTRNGDWLREFKLKNVLNEKVDILFFLGCVSSVPKYRRLVRIALDLLAKLQMDVGILGDSEKCCGGPLLQVGAENEFKRLAEYNLEILRSLGDTKIVTYCPQCFKTLKVDYYKYTGSKINVIHISELFHMLLKERKIRWSRNVNLEITYHDPCNLGRLNNLGRLGIETFKDGYEMPREILRSIPGIKLVEMKRIKEDTLCCGYGGGVGVGFFELAQWTASKRIEEALTTGAKYLVTSCPYCAENLIEAKTKTKSNINVLDLVEIIQLGL